MAAALRSSASRLLASQRTASRLPMAIAARSISSKFIRDLEGRKRPPPFDYKNKNYNFFRCMVDTTTKRIDENSAIILVDGPIASGKTAFGEQLAEELDMAFVPGVNLDDYYVNNYGYDMRQYNHLLPVKARTFDTSEYLADPHHINVAAYQMHLLRLKYEKYYDALAHVLNTGQGVVIERSVYSDFVFVEAMLRAGYISKNFYRAYQEMLENTMCWLLKPHLAIYLDVPVDVVAQNIKKRNDPAEINSPVLKNLNYLKDIEFFYKQEFLKEIGKSSEILVYDWSNGGEVDLVVEDIERIDFDSYEKHDLKLHDWRFLFHEREWRDARRMYTNQIARDRKLRLFDIPITYCDELILSPEEAKEFCDVWFDAPGYKYEYGYNPDQGDNVWFKSGVPKTLPRAPKKPIN